MTTKLKRNFLALILSVLFAFSLLPLAFTFAKAADEPPPPEYPAGEFADPYDTWTAEGANSAVLKKISDAFVDRAEIPDPSNPLKGKGRVVIYNAGGKYIQQDFFGTNNPRGTYNALLDEVIVLYMANSTGNGWSDGGNGATKSRNRSAVGSPIDEMTEISKSNAVINDANLRKMDGTYLDTGSGYTLLGTGFKYQNFTYGYLIRQQSNGEIFFSRGNHISFSADTFTITPIPSVDQIGAELNYWATWGDGGEGFSKLNLEFDQMVINGIHPHDVSKAINDAAKTITGASNYNPAVVELNSTKVIDGDLNSYYRNDTEKVVKWNGIIMQMLHSEISTGQPFKAGSEKYLQEYDSGSGAYVKNRNMFIVYNPANKTAYPVVDEIATLYGNSSDYQSIGSAADTSYVTEMGYPLGAQTESAGVITQEFSNGTAIVKNGVPVFRKSGGGMLNIDDGTVYSGLIIQEDDLSIDVGTANSVKLSFKSSGYRPNDTIVFYSSNPEFVTVSQDGIVTGVASADYGSDPYKEVTIGIYSQKLIEKMNGITPTRSLEIFPSDTISVYVKKGGVKAQSISFKEDSYSFAWNKHFAPEVVIVSEHAGVPVTGEYTISCDNPLIRIESNDVVKNDILVSGVDALDGILTVSLPQSAMVSGKSNSDTAPIQIYPSTVGMFDPGYNGKGVSWFNDGGRTRADYSQAFVDAYCHIAFEQGFLMGEGSKDESRIREWNGFLIQEFLSPEFEYSIWNRKHAYLIIDDPSLSGGEIIAYPLMSTVLKWMEVNGKGLGDIGAPTSYEYRAHGMVYQNYRKGLMVIDPDYRQSRFLENYKIEEVAGALTVKNANNATVSLTSISFASGSANELVAGESKNVYIQANSSHPFSAVSYSVSDSSILTVDEFGKIKGLKEGTVTITATSKFNPTLKTTLSVTVKKAAEVDAGNKTQVIVRDVYDNDPAGWEIALIVIGSIALVAGLAGVGFIGTKIILSKKAAAAGGTKEPKSNNEQ